LSLFDEDATVREAVPEPPVPELEHVEERPYLGRSVQGGRIRYSSVSQIKIFDPLQDGGCNRKWAYQYVFGKREVRKTEAKIAGSDYGRKLEHYLKTGEDVLPPVLQAGKNFFPVPGPDLEVEEPFGDIVAAVALRDAMLRNGDPSLAVEIGRLAGLAASGIPLDGAADCRHVRGEYIDSEGVLVREHPGTRVVEVIDLKTTVRIYPHVIRRGERAGTMLPGYARTAAEICEDPQMVGYGKHAADRYDPTHVRLSHVVCNKNKREAVKRTGLISVDEVRRRFRRIEDVVRRMEQAATAARPEDVEPNLAACDAFTHVDAFGETQKGCMHRSYCPLSYSQTVSTMLGNTNKESGMSLFDEIDAPPLPAAANPPPPIPSAPPPSPLANGEVEHAAAVEAEKKRLLAEDAAMAGRQDMSRLCPACGEVLSVDNTSRLPNGALKHIGCAAGTPALAPLPPPPPPPRNIAAVNPPDSPTPSLLDAADPLPPEEIAKITDPALRKKVEAHARAHAERDAAEAAARAADRGGIAVYCAGSEQKIAVTIEKGLSGKHVCECGRSFSFKTHKPVREGDAHVLVVPRHRLPKADADAASPPPPPSASTEAVLSAFAAAAPSPRWDEPRAQGGQMTSAPNGEGGRTVQGGGPPTPSIAPPPPSALPIAPSPPPPPPPAPSITPPPPSLPLIPFAPAITFDSRFAPSVSHANGAAIAPVPPPPPAPVAGRSTAMVNEMFGAPEAPRPTLPLTVPVAVAGIRLYVDVLAERGPALRPLEDYYAPHLRALERQFNVVDVRTVAKDSPLAYGGWKGALSAKCREAPPPPGDYYARGSDEFANVAVEALSPLPLCSGVYRKVSGG
jgi:hypothetical protein